MTLESKSIEIKGKTVDDAIMKGLSALALAIDEVDIEIIHEGSKGIFGFGRSALVRITQKEDGFSEAFKLETDNAPKVDEKKEKAAEEPVIKDEKNEKKDKKPKQPVKAEKIEKKPKPAEAKEKIEKQPVVYYDKLTPLGESARDFLMGAVNRMGVNVVLSTSESDETIYIDIKSEQAGMLIGRRGETLDALQYLTSLAVNKADDTYKRIILDTENYRAKREESLVRLANKIANQVIRTGRKVVLEPMNPYERRILHSTLQSNDKVDTLSEGVEPYRKVVVVKRRSGGNRGKSKGRNERQQ